MDCFFGEERVAECRGDGQRQMGSQVLKSKRWDLPMRVRAYGAAEGCGQRRLCCRLRGEGCAVLGYRAVTLKSDNEEGIISLLQKLGLLRIGPGRAGNGRTSEGVGGPIQWDDWKRCRKYQRAV